MTLTINSEIVANKCTKCGAETTNLVVCNSCNVPPGETKYYQYISKYRGECFFRVQGSGQDVLQIVTKTVAKAGSYKLGCYYIRYNSFIGSKGWKLKKRLREDDSNIKEIAQAAFEDVLRKVTEGFFK